MTKKDKLGDMLIGGLQKITLIDFPGHIAATVFTVGCNFSCPFCHNPELVDGVRIKEQPLLSEDDFFNFLKLKQGLLEGVCITGGEPTIHPDLLHFIDKIKRMDFKIKLDTNGSRPDILGKLLNKRLVDYLAMDIKGPLEKYHQIVGSQIDLERIHESTVLARQFPDYEFRTTVVPGLHKKADFLSIARWLEGAKKYFLQQFRPGKTLDVNFSKKQPYPDEKLAEFSRVVEPYFEVCKIRI
ncbi:MAG: anaerobic ribonucleoside-triphosphate reductase activating protein [Candidatus Portnoybacteria bacterium]|nr:anaerobic ribonucleoside-triphosphate reductase activating protein [Candidatus Portnoybacteria bacterium]